MQNHIQTSYFNLYPQRIVFERHSFCSVKEDTTQIMDEEEGGRRRGEQAVTSGEIAATGGGPPQFETGPSGQDTGIMRSSRLARRLLTPVP